MRLPNPFGRQPQPPADREQLLTAEQVADWLNIPVRVLADWRYEGHGPPVARLSRKTLRYRRGDVADWIADQVGAP